MIFWLIELTPNWGTVKILSRQHFALFAKTVLWIKPSDQREIRCKPMHAIVSDQMTAHFRAIFARRVTVRGICQRRTTSVWDSVQTYMRLTFYESTQSHLPADAFYASKAQRPVWIDALTHVNALVDSNVCVGRCDWHFVFNEKHN